MAFVKGTGPHGVILKEDVERAAGSAKKTAAKPQKKAPAKQQAAQDSQNYKDINLSDEEQSLKELYKY